MAMGRTPQAHKPWGSGREARGWEDDRMDLGALLAALLCFAASFMLFVLSAWFRWGSSGLARWWVRRVPVEQMFFKQSAGEATALGLFPYFAQLMAAVGVVALVHVHPVVRETLFTPVMWTVAVGELILLLVVMVLVGNRNILALFVYPGWLRPQRRAERRWLDGHR